VNRFSAKVLKLMRKTSKIHIIEKRHFLKDLKSLKKSIKIPKEYKKIYTFVKIKTTIRFNGTRKSVIIVDR
jgi:hypothetical protein